MAGKENEKKRGNKQAEKRFLLVVHLRSVLGNLNTCFGLLALEICALQARLVCSIFSRINRLCYRRLSGISSQYSCGEKVMQCHYRKLTGESDIGVRAPLPLSGRASFLCCSLAEMASPMALPSSAMPVLCSVGLLLGDSIQDHLNPITISLFSTNH